MAEMDRILKQFKECKLLCKNVNNEIKNILGVHNGFHKDIKDVTNYGPFVLKLLRLCVSHLETAIASDDFSGIYEIVNECCRIMLMQTADNFLQTHKTLQLAKLLYHIIFNFVKLEKINYALDLSSYLFSFLKLSHGGETVVTDAYNKENISPQTTTNISKELLVIFNNTYLLLWNVAARMEQNDQISLKQILHLRYQALHFISYAAPNNNIILDRASKAILVAEHRLPDDQFFDLVEFFKNIANILKDRCSHKFTNLNQNFDSSVCDYLEFHMEFIKVLSRRGSVKEALVIVDDLQNILSDFYSKKTCLLRQYFEYCLKLCKTSILLLKHGQKNAKESSEEFYNSLKSCRCFIHQLLKAKTFSSIPLSSILFSCTVFINSLESCINKKINDNNGKQSVVSCQTLNSIEKFLNAYIELLEAASILGKVSLTKLAEAKLKIWSSFLRLLSNQVQFFEVLPDSGSWKPHDFVDRCLKIINHYQSIIDDVYQKGYENAFREYSYLGTDTVNLGILYYNRGLYVDALSFLDLACKQLLIWCNESQNTYLERCRNIQLWKTYEFKAECQRRLGLYKDALSSVISGLQADSNHLTSAVDLWVRIKKDAVRHNPDSEVKSRILKVCLEEVDMFGDIDCAQLLQLELKAYKNERSDMSESSYAVLNELLKYNDDPLDHAWCLIEMAQLLWYSGLKNIQFAVNHCKKAISILEDCLDSSEEAININQVKDLMACAYLWLYLADLQVILEDAQLDKSAEVNSSSNVSEEEESEDSFNLTSCKIANVEAEYTFMQALDRALDLWLNCDKTQVINAEVTVSNLKILTSIYQLTNRPVQALLSLSGLLATVHHVGVLYDIVLLQSQVILALFKLGLYEAAEEIANNSKTFREQLNNNCVDDIQAELNFLLAYSELLLLTGKINEGYKVLTQVSSHEYLIKKNRHSYMLQAHCKTLDYKYKIIPPNYFQPASGSMDSALDLAYDAMRQHLALARLMLGECCSALANNRKMHILIESAAVKHCVISHVLESLLCVGQQFLHCGSIREAKCYLKEGLALAHKFLLPKRAAEFVLALSYLDLKSDSFKNSNNKLSRLEHYLSIDKYLQDDIINPCSENFSSHPTVCKCSGCTDSSIHELIQSYILVRTYNLYLQQQLSDCFLSAEAGLITAENSVHQISQMCSMVRSVLNVNNLRNSPPKNFVKSGKQAKSQICKSVQKTKCFDLIIFKPFLCSLYIAEAKVFILEHKLVEALECIEKVLNIFTCERNNLLPLQALTVKAEALYLMAKILILQNTSSRLGTMHLFLSAWKSISTTDDLPVMHLDFETLLLEEQEELKASAVKKNGTKASSRGRGKKKVVVPTFKSLKKTRAFRVELITEYLTDAYNLLHHNPAAPLFQQVCQLLVFCYGDVNCWDSSFYLNQTAMVTLRQQALLCLTKKLRRLNKDDNSRPNHELPSEEMEKLSLSVTENLESLQRRKKLLVFSDSRDNFRNILQSLPEGWTVCQLSLVPLIQERNQHQLVIWQCRADQEPVVVCSSAVTLAEDGDLIAECQNIISESTNSIHENDKKIWWETRRRLDQRMKELLENMEDDLLNYWKGLLLGQPTDQAIVNKLSKAAINLQTWCKAKLGLDIRKDWLQMLLDSADYLSSHQIASAITSFTGFLSQDALHAEFLQKIHKYSKQLATTTISRQPVILILDKMLQQLPWESINFLKEQPVSRMPSLYFIGSHLALLNEHLSILQTGLVPKKVYYILNPSGDLDHTQEKFENWFNQEGWSGVIGKAPTSSQFVKALTHHDIFIYCGHGAGYKYLPGDEIQKIQCRAATLLMGCSSGKLTMKGELEATGMVLNYLLAGCPCVVANLWDVTDKDIDRFLESVLHSWLYQANSELGRIVSVARNACKLSYLVGAAPVIYGFPIKLGLNALSNKFIK